MRNLSWMWLALLVLVGCGDQFTEEEEKALKDLIKDEVVADAELEEEIVWEKDGKEMVLIPAGSFEMGDHFNDGVVGGRELPVHTVQLDAFYMDVHEVTVGQFKQFVEQSGYNYGGNWDKIARYSPGDEYPMIYVNWIDATAYARWAGKRLPTEAEWEYAARGGLAGRRYSWGDGEELARDYANYSGIGGKDVWEGWPNGGTAPVGSFAANGYGLYGIAGNVLEWCQDWLDKDYYNNSPTKNPPGPDTGSYRVSRGGSWLNAASTLRVAYRGSFLPDYRNGSFGFRCVSGSNFP